MRPRSRTLGALLDEVAAARPDAEAVVFRGERLTYATLRERADVLARALLALGVERGDRVALLLPNRPEWVIGAFAAAKVGALTVAVSTFSTPREIAWALEHARPRVLITMEAFRGRPFLDAVAALCPELGRSAPGALRSERVPELQAVVSVQGARHDGVYGGHELLGRASEVRESALSAAQAAVGPADIAYLLYTSGSTATPKGVTLAHGGVIANGFDIGERMRLTGADRVWLAVPLFWSFGSANALPALLTHGGGLVLQETFEPGEALALLAGERCSVYYGMANMARAILEHPDRARRALAAMRTGLTIGLPEDIRMTMEAVSAPELCNVYGLTETYGNCAVTDAGDPLEQRLTTQGLPLPGMQIRVVDQASGHPLPPGEVGELRVRGHVTPGYYRDPEQTRAAFDGEGWFITGDLGLLRTDGRVCFRGRLKELIKTGGANVAPLEVEAVRSGADAVGAGDGRAHRRQQPLGRAGREAADQRDHRRPRPLAGGPGAGAGQPRAGQPPFPGGRGGVPGEAPAAVRVKGVGRDRRGAMLGWRMVDALRDALTTSTSSRSRTCAPPESCAPPPVVDKALVAARVAAVRDATARVRAVLPASTEAFAADRTAREVVILSLDPVASSPISTAHSTGVACTPWRRRRSVIWTRSVARSRGGRAGRGEAGSGARRGPQPTFQRERGGDPFTSGDECPAALPTRRGNTAWGGLADPAGDPPRRSTRAIRSRSCRLPPGRTRALFEIGVSKSSLLTGFRVRGALALGTPRGCRPSEAHEPVNAT
jgi:fatty-acyl-CoA synthase